jgi:hypothetical protein
MAVKNWYPIATGTCRFPPIGSPFQINFLPANSTAPGVVALNDTSLVSCGDNAFRCSCSDCPTGPGCQAVSCCQGHGVISACMFGGPQAICWLSMFLFDPSAALETRHPRSRFKR